MKKVLNENEELVNKDIVTLDIENRKKMRRKSRIKEMAIIIPSIIIAIGGLIGIFIWQANLFARDLGDFLNSFGKDANDFFEAIDEIDKAVNPEYDVVEERDDGTWCYTVYYMESNPSSGYAVITGITETADITGELVVPVEFDGYPVCGFDLKETLELNTKLNFDRACYLAIFSTYERNDKYGIENCKAILNNNLVTLSFGWYLFELLRDANTIYINRPAYDLLQMEREVGEWSLDNIQANIQIANVSFMYNYEQTEGEFEVNYHYVVLPEYQDAVDAELELAQTEEEKIEIYKKYNAVRLDLSLYNNGYYWIDNLENGEKLTIKPKDPEREGYTFAGWYIDEACTQAFDFDTFIKGDADLVLYANWIANE